MFLCVSTYVIRRRCTCNNVIIITPARGGMYPTCGSVVRELVVQLCLKKLTAASWDLIHRSGWFIQILRRVDRIERI